MEFREWLKLVEASELTRHRNNPNVPPDSDEFGSRSTEPRGLLIYKDKLKNAKRTTAVISKYLPTDGWWHHKQATNEPATKVLHNAPITFHNIDPQSILDIPIVSGDSPTIPGEGWWVHNPNARPHVLYKDIR